MASQNPNVLNPLEVDLEIAIEEAYRRDPEQVRKKGLFIYGHMIRQPELKGYGTPDLITWELRFNRYAHGWEKAWRHLHVHVVELKRDTLQLNHVTQVCRYMRGVHHLFNMTELPNQFSLHVHGHLIGKTIDMSNDMCYVMDSINMLNVYRWKLDLQHGIRFDLQTGWYEQSQNPTDFLNYVASQGLPAVKSEYRRSMEEIWSGRKMHSVYDEQP